MRNGQLVYIDDVLVFSEDRLQHVKHLEHVFAALEAQGYHVRLEKCTFLRDTVSFLGHVISPEGIHAAENRESVLNGFQDSFYQGEGSPLLLGDGHVVQVLHSPCSNIGSTLVRLDVDEEGNSNGLPRWSRQ